MKKVIAMRIFFFKYVACLRFCFCTSQLVPSLAFAFNQKMLLAYFTAKPKVFRNNFITVLVASSSVALSTGLYLYELIRFWLDCCKYSLPLSVTIICLSVCLLLPITQSFESYTLNANKRSVFVSPQFSQCAFVSLRTMLKRGFSFGFRSNDIDIDRKPDRKRDSFQRNCPHKGQTTF
jgi:hypothetical protein